VRSTPNLLATGLEPARGNLVQEAPLGVLDAGGRDRVVEPRILRMDGDECPHAVLDGLLQGEGGDDPDQTDQPLPESLIVTAADFGNDRLLVRKVLVEGADRDPSPFRYPVRGYARALRGSESE